MAGIQEPLLPVPGFSFLGVNIGIRDERLDFGVAAAEAPCAAAAVFTRNNFPGAPVIVGREHARGGRLQAVVVNSKNANVATGAAGLEHARRVCRVLGHALGIAPELVLPGSTGVIGVPLPVAKLEAACARAPGLLAGGRDALERFARAILTTDTRPKAVSVKIGGATLTGVAKGAGMIEPHMATMLAYFFTDAGVPAPALQAMLGRAVACSFNRVSVDSDTSTSDTAAVLANGSAGPVNPAALEAALTEAATYLAREIARDGEGATKLIDLRVTGAPSPEAALRFAKAIVNSPLIKTAIHGADPNWGRFVMAVGKVFEYPIPIERLAIRFGTAPDAPVVTVAAQRPAVLAAVAEYLKRDEVHIEVSLGSGPHAERVWGCDLTEAYVRENASYTS